MTQAKHANFPYSRRPKGYNRDAQRKWREKKRRELLHLENERTLLLSASTEPLPLADIEDGLTLKLIAKFKQEGWD